MWLRSEKRSSRIALPKTRPSINLRKIIKTTPALKNLKQLTTDVTPTRRYGTGNVCGGIGTTKNGKTLRKSGNAKQLPSTKCNMKSTAAAGVKRLIKKSRSSVGKRHEKKKFVAVAAAAEDHQNRVRLPRKSLRTTLDNVGKENRWRDQEESNVCLVDKRRGKMRSTVAEHSEATDPVDTAQNMLPRVETCNGFAFGNDSCDSCKPSTVCSCSSSSNQTDDIQSNSGLDVPKADCVNYIECDSTTDNDKINAPSTSMLINPVGLIVFLHSNVFFFFWFFV